MKMLARVALFSLLCAAPAPAANAADTVWNFDGSLAAASGPGVMTFRGTTGAQAQFGTAASFGLPPLPGGDKTVMRFPATSPSQGLLVDHASPANGVHEPDGYLSNYTLVYDILWPAASAGVWRSMFQTNLQSSNDGDLYVSPDGAIGISGSYQGSLPANTWKRVVIVVGAADNEGQMQKYIDGQFVGGQGTTGSAISSRWSLFAQAGADCLLFADDSNETAEGYISSFRFIDRRLTQAEVAALGGPTAGGAGVAGVPWSQPPGTARRIEVIAHRGDSALAPENTLPAIEQAIAAGAQHIEIDIRLTSDGVAVLMHDSDLFRTTDSSGPVSGRTAAGLALLDAGSWFASQFVGTRPPTLAQAFQAMRGRATPYLDVKVDGMGPAIAAALQQAGMTGRDIWVWTYSSASFNGIQAAVPDARFVAGFVPSTVTPTTFEGLRAQGYAGFDLNMSQLRSAPAGFVDGAHGAGMFVSAYTILDPPTMLEVIALGGDMMETDFPTQLFALMGPAAPVCGDADRDGDVDFNDLNIVLGQFGRSGHPGTFRGDINRDGLVNFVDLNLVLGRFGGSCP